MATRSSRRSSGRDSFNPAMIHLLDADRLRKELENRGLDTKGNRSVLADRLQDAVDAEKSSRHSYSPPPVTEKPQSKRNLKRTSKAADVTDTSQLELSPAVSSAKKKRLATPPTESVEVIEESFSIQISEDAVCSINSNRTVEENVENSPMPCVESSLGVKADAKVKVSKSSPKKTSKKSLSEKIQKRKASESNEGAGSKETGLQLTFSAEKPLGIKIKKIEVMVNDSKKDHMEGGTSKKKPEKHLEKVGEKRDGDKAQNSNESLKEISQEVSSKRYIKIDAEEQHEKIVNKEESKQNKVLKLKLKLDYDKDLHAGSGIERKESRKLSEIDSQKNSDASLEAVPLNEGIKKKLSKQGIIEKIKDAKEVTSGENEKNPEVEKKKDTVIRKKIPLRMQAVDVFDTIFDKQTELLSSKFKSEEEKAAERQKIELAKRRQSSAQLPVVIPSPTPMEKRRHTVEFNLSPQIFPSRRVPPPPPPPLPLHVGSSEGHKPSLQRKLTPPPPPPLPKRKGVSFDGNSMSVILPAPPPPPVLVSSLPPPPPPPFPQSSALQSTSVECDVPSTESDIASTKSSSVELGSPLPLSNLISVISPATGSAMHSSYSSPAISKSGSSHLVSPNASTSQSPPRSCSFSEPTTSSLEFTEVGNSNSHTEVREGLPLQQIAKALCSVFAHIGSKSQNFEDNPEEDETAESSQQVLSSGVSRNEEHLVNNAATTVAYEELSNPFMDFDVSLIRALLNDVIDRVVTSLEKEGRVPDSSFRSEILVENDHVKETENLAEDIAEKEVELDSVDSKNDSVTNEEKDEQKEQKTDICEALMRDPLWLLRKASDIIKNLEAKSTTEPESEEISKQYVQISPDPDYEAGDEEKPLPAFYGEPVPDDDDIVIEGSKRKSSSKKIVVQEEEPIPGDENIEIDFYNADLHIKASEANKFLIDPDNGDGFALMWGGARSNFGIKVPEDLKNFPRVAFQAKIKEFLPIIHLPFEELDPHDVRIGWSLGNTSNTLGELSHSFAFSSLARKAVNGVFTDYGEPFHINDVITAVLDMEKDEISYYKNAQCLGVAFSELGLSRNDEIFPHICTKNCKVEVNFGDGESQSWMSLDKLEDRNSEKGALKFISGVERKYLIRGPVAPPAKSDCTVLMMVGLPGVGKSTWVRQYLRDHPHEQWTLLSTDAIISAMKVNGIARSRVHQGRWDMIMGLTAKAMNRSLHLACRRRRNYIIDQTNVSRETRRRKLSQFKDFQRKCVVIIPSEEEMLSRQARQVRVDGVSATPVEAMLELKASFAIPNTENEPIEGVYFVEPPLEKIGEAIELVNRFNDEARPWCQKKRGRRGERGAGGGDYNRQGDRSTNSYSQKTMSQIPNDNVPPIVNCDPLDETALGSAQPSPNLSSRINEGYCGFGNAVPPSLHSSVELNVSTTIPAMDPTVPPPSAWVDPKKSFV